MSDQNPQFLEALEKDDRVGVVRGVPRQQQELQRQSRGDTNRMTTTTTSSDEDDDARQYIGRSDANSFNSSCSSALSYDYDSDHLQRLGDDSGLDDDDSNNDGNYGYNQQPKDDDDDQKSEEGVLVIPRKPKGIILRTDDKDKNDPSREYHLQIKKTVKEKKMRRVRKKAVGTDFYNPKATFALVSAGKQKERRLGVPKPLRSILSSRHN